MIASTSNPQVKNLVRLREKAKTRRQQGVYIVEGVRMFREAPADRICGIYVSESFAAQPENAALLDEKTSASSGETMQRGEPSSERRCEVLSDAVFNYVSDTKTPQGILCLIRMRQYSLGEILGEMPDETSAAIRPGDAPAAQRPAASGGLWLALECLQDPGNLGTIFRTAEGAGVTGILMDASTADIYNPKTIRSTMGSIFRVPFLVTDDLPAALEEMKKCRIRIFAAHLDGSVGYTEPDYTGPAAFLIGNEGNGLSGAALAAADVSVHIPMRGQLESLNASTAAGILLYEADRQRRL